MKKSQPQEDLGKETEGTTATKALHREGFGELKKNQYDRSDRENAQGVR